MTFDNLLVAAASLGALFYVLLALRVNHENEKAALLRKQERDDLLRAVSLIGADIHKIDERLDKLEQKQ